ncbi:hypothetical protein [Streptomyces griseus]|uniref:hypothetical protein n=1 Tax=Streptomyces griseus TaxID=1911 RepID=UPI0033A32641
MGDDYAKFRAEIDDEPSVEARYKGVPQHSGKKPEGEEIPVDAGASVGLDLDELRKKGLLSGGED